MNEQAIIDSYILFKKDGYLKSFQEFKQLITTNPNALNDSYELFKKDGYTKSLNDYKILMGVTSQSLEPNPTPNPAPNPNPSPSNDFPPCASKKGKVVKTPKGMDVIVYKTTVWDTPLVQLFAKSTRFMVLGGKHKGEKGNYKCLQNNKLFLELDSVKNAGLKKSESKITSTTLTLDDILNGKGSVKMGMKGPVVGEIQKLLIAAGYKDISKSGEVDNTFGGRTKKMVKDFQDAIGLNDDGIVGKDTLPKLKDGSTKKSEYTLTGDKEIPTEIPTEKQKTEPITPTNAANNASDVKAAEVIVEPITPPAVPAEPVFDRNRLQELLASKNLVKKRNGVIVKWTGPELKGNDYYILDKYLIDKGYIQKKQRETNDRDDEDVTMRYKWKLQGEELQENIIKNIVIKNLHSLL